MRLATFNAENLFDRPKAMNLDNPQLGDQILSDFATLNTLIENETYAPEVKAKIADLFSRNDQYIKLNEIHGKLITQSNKKIKVVAAGRASWIGWFELIEEHVKELAIENTGRVIGALNADVTCIIEAEDRPSLKEFNKTVLPKSKRFDHVMAVPGNDPRGINVAILVREPLKITDMVSHVDDKDSVGEVFSRDCAEYTIQMGEKGPKLLVMVNHFKAKDQNAASSDQKRKRQADRVREIYEQRKKGFDYIAIMGDFNDTPDSAPLRHLIQDGSDLLDVMSQSVRNFDNGGFPGTYQECTAGNKIDYILMSPKLAEKFTAGGVERHGIWAGKNGKKFEHFQMNSSIDAASDHAGLWADFDLKAA